MTSLLNLDVLQDAGSPISANSGKITSAAAILQYLFVERKLVDDEIITDIMSDPAQYPYTVPLANNFYLTQREVATDIAPQKSWTMAPDPRRNLDQGIDHITSAFKQFVSALGRARPVCALIAGEHSSGLLINSDQTFGCQLAREDNALHFHRATNRQTIPLGSISGSELLGSCGLIIGLDNGLASLRIRSGGYAQAAPWIKASTGQSRYGAMVLGWISRVKLRDSILNVEKNQRYCMDPHSFLYAFADGLSALAEERFPGEKARLIPELRESREVRKEVALLWGRSLLQYHPDLIEPRQKSLRLWLTNQRLWRRASSIRTNTSSLYGVRTVSDAQTVTFQKPDAAPQSLPLYSSLITDISAEVAVEKLKFEHPIGRLDPPSDSATSGGTAKRNNPSTTGSAYFFDAKTFPEHKHGNQLDEIILVAKKFHILGYCNSEPDDDSRSFKSWNAFMRSFSETIELFQLVITGTSTVSKLRKQFDSTSFLKGARANDKRLSITAGRIIPGDYTHRWLVAENAPKWKKLEVGTKPGDDGGEQLGFYNIEVDLNPYGTGKSHTYGSHWLQEAITEAGKYFEDNHRKGSDGICRIAINDASLACGARTRDHTTHQAGLDCDCRLASVDGDEKHKSWDWEHGDYDGVSMEKQLRSFWKHEHVRKILFNDKRFIKLGLSRFAHGHNNHMHLTIMPRKAIAPGP